MFLSFCFSLLKHNIILLLKYTWIGFISIKLPWENKSKNGKNTKNIPVFEKATQLVARTFGGRKKKEKISKSETVTFTYFDNLKKKQQDQGSTNWCYTESFMSLTISSLRTTVFCFENTKLLKEILNIIQCILWERKKKGHQAHTGIFKFSKITFQ